MDNVVCGQLFVSYRDTVGGVSVISLRMKDSFGVEF